MNQSRTHSLLFVLFLGLLFGGGLSAGASFRGAEDAVRYVDVQRCLDEWGAIQVEVESLSQEFSAKLKEFRSRDGSLQEQENELAILNPSSDEYSSALFQIEGARADVERERRFVADRLQKRKIQLLLRGWKSVQEAAAAMAAQQGWSAVVAIPQTLTLVPENLAAEAESLSFRSVLWTHPDHDVTDLILSNLNAQN